MRSFSQLCLLVLAVMLAAGLSACSLFGGEEETKDCNPYPDIDYESRVTIQQGVAGRIWLWEGDFFPPIDCDSGTIEPVGRKIFIHEKASLDQVRPHGTHKLYDEVKTPLIKTGRSDDEGFYEVTLSPGEYSIFIEVEGRFYAYGFHLSEGDGGYAAPFDVERDTVTFGPININHRATF